MKNDQFLGKLAKESSKLSPQRDPVRARTSPERDPIRARTSLGCPRSASKRRAPSLVIGSSDEQQHGGWKGKIEVDWFYVNYQLGYSIGHDPLIYIEGVVLFQQETLSRHIFHVSHEFGIVQIRIQKPRSKQGFLFGLSELPTPVRTFDRRNFRHGTTPSTQASFLRFLGSYDVLHPDSELDVPYMFFDHLDERNVMVKSNQDFDNFTKPAVTCNMSLLGCAQTKQGYITVVTQYKTTVIWYLSLPARSLNRQ